MTMNINDHDMTSITDESIDRAETLAQSLFHGQLFQLI
jgi:hypothetical protein